MRHAVEVVPAGLVARFGFECQLDDDAAGADILLSADVATGGLDALAGLSALAPGWEPVTRFARQREPGSLLARATDDLWVELDTAADEARAPSVFFGLRVAGLLGPPAASIRRTLDEGYAALLGRPPAPPVRETLQATIERLPPRVSVFQAGAMLSRPDVPLRICLSSVAPKALVGLVEAVRDGSEARTLDGVLADLTAPAHRVCLGIDIAATGGVGERVGLECYGNLAAVLDRLVAAGLCTPAKHEALLLCEGSLRDGEAEPWPTRLSELASLLGPTAHGEIGWYVHHVKVVCDRGLPVGAKAYVLVWHRCTL